MGDSEPPKAPQVVENRPHFQVATRFLELFGAQVVDSLPLFLKTWQFFAHFFRKCGRVSTTKPRFSTLWEARWSIFYHLDAWSW